MRELTRRGLIFGGAALAAAGVFAGVDHVASSTFVKDEPPLGPDTTVEIVEFDDAGKRVGKMQVHRVRKTLAEWRNVLTTPQFVITRKAATEIPYSGELLKEHRAGIYRCADCGTALFDAKTKFESGTGWPGSDCGREYQRERRLQHGHIAARSEVHALRCASGTRLSGRSGPDRAALLHEFGGVEVCAAASRLNFNINYRPGIVSRPAPLRVV